MRDLENKVLKSPIYDKHHNYKQCVVGDVFRKAFASEDRNFEMPVIYPAPQIAFVRVILQLIFDNIKK